MVDEQCCLVCTKKESKVFSHLRGYQRIYKNFAGQEWSGNKCPECYAKYKKEYDAKRRLKKGHDVMDTIRVCTKCSEQFPVTRGGHKTCKKCR